MIYARSRALTDLGLVVLDEVHFLQDAYRGPVWEEVIIHLPAQIRLVCLSATVSNADELAAWIETVRGPTSVVVETRRPVRLDDHYLVGDRTNDRLYFLPTFVGGFPNPDADEDRQPGGAPRPSRAQAGARQRTARAVHARARRDDRTARRARPAAGDLLHLQPQPMPRSGCRRRRRRAADHRRDAARRHSRDRRRASRRPRRGRSRGARLRRSRCPTGRRCRPASRRHGAGVQGGGGALLRRRAARRRLRHRDPGRRRQHAGAHRRHREADEVHRRPPRVADAGGVHAVDRTCRPSRHRRRRPGGRVVEPVRPLRPCRRARRQPFVQPAIGVPAHLQHGRQPGARLQQRTGPPPAQPVLRAVPVRPRRGPSGGACRAPPRRCRRGAGGGSEPVRRHLGVPTAAGRRPPSGSRRQPGGGAGQAAPR